MTIRTLPQEVRIASDHFELRETATDGQYLEGVAAPLGQFRDVGPFFERLDPSVFDRSIEQRGTKLPLMMMHDSHSIPVGVAVNWSKTYEEDALIGVWRFDTRAEAKEAHRLVAEGIIHGLSVGFAPGKDANDNKVEHRDGKTYVDRRVARLLETSLVAQPAFEDAEVIAVRTAGVEPLPDFSRRDQAAARLRDIDALLKDIPELL